MCRQHASESRGFRARLEWIDGICAEEAEVLGLLQSIPEGLEVLGLRSVPGFPEQSDHLSEHSKLGPGGIRPHVAHELPRDILKGTPIQPVVGRERLEQRFGVKEADGAVQSHALVFQLPPHTLGMGPCCDDEDGLPVSKSLRHVGGQTADKDTIILPVELHYVLTGFGMLQKIRP